MAWLTLAIWGPMSTFKEVSSQKQAIFLEHFAQGDKVVKNITHEAEEEQIIASFQVGKYLFGPAENCS